MVLSFHLIGLYTKPVAIFVTDAVISGNEKIHLTQLMLMMYYFLNIIEVLLRVKLDLIRSDVVKNANASELKH